MRLIFRVGVLAIFVSVAGCNDKNKVVLTEVVVNAPRQLDDDVEDKDAIRRAVIESIRGDRLISWKPGTNTRTHVLKVRIGDVLDGDHGAGEFRLVTVHLKGVANEFSYRVDGQGTTPEDLRSSVLSGFRDAWKVIQFEREMDLATHPPWVESLNHSDWRIREFALDRIAKKRVMEALPFLYESLNTEHDVRLRLRIIGVLAELKDPRAVAPLVAITRHKNPALLLQVLHALGQIGGREAEAFLVTVATGHSIDGVRRVAGEILKGMGADQRSAAEVKLPQTSPSPQ